MKGQDPTILFEKLHDQIGKTHLPELYNIGM